MRRSYDYVIVGAGSAGCVLASRLTEDPDVSVALLEAGGERPPAGDPDAGRVPGVVQVELRLGPARRARARARRSPAVPAARAVLGGCGSINAMIYIRGNRADYDGWAAGGAEGWGYDEVLPYFRRSEDNERGEDAFHGAGGPLAVADSRSMHPLVDTMLEAARAGRPRAQPGLQRRPPGGRRPLPADPARRLRVKAPPMPSCDPAQQRSEPRVIPRAMALRIVFEGTARRRRRRCRRRAAAHDARPARGDPVGRRLPVAGAPDAVGNRSRGPARAVRNRGPRVDCRSGTTSRTTAWRSSTT